jgi:hypothetical protein
VLFCFCEVWSTVWSTLAGKVGVLFESFLLMIFIIVFSVVPKEIMMNKSLKNTFIFLFGLLAGAGGASFWMMTQVDNQKKLDALFVVSSEINEADRLYRGVVDPKVAIYALQRALGSIESYKQKGFYQQGISIAWDTGLLNARIGRMYQKVGDERLASEYFQKAIESFSKDGWIFGSTQELNKAVDLIDNNQIIDAINKYGKIKK